MNTRHARIPAALAGGALALSLALSGCGSSDSPAGTAAAEAGGSVAMGEHVGADAFLAGIESTDAIVIDVRTPEEFASGHLDGAVNLNVSDAAFAQEIAALDPAGTYAVYCRSGNRSRTAMEQMQDAGIANVFGLEGGVGALTPSDLVTG